MESLSSTNMNLLLELIRQHEKGQIPFVKQQFIRKLVGKRKQELITKRDIMNAILRKNEEELSKDDDDNFQPRRRGCKSRRCGCKSRRRGCKSRRRGCKSRRYHKTGFDFQQQFFYTCGN